MSPRWNRAVRLRVGTGAVDASVRAGWPRAVAVAAARRVVEDASPPAAGIAPHAQAIEAVLGELGAATPIRGARLEVEIASALLHLDVVEGDFGASTDRQLQGIATACVSEMLGDEASRRAVRWHLQRDDRHLLIVALAEDWIELLKAAAESAGLRLASIEPAFVARWNDSGGAMTPATGVFAVCTRADLAIAAVADGAIAAISVGAGVDLQRQAPGPGPRTPEALARSGSVAASGFSSDRDGAAALDERVDRFLSGRGQDPDTPAAFVVLASDEAVVAASKRWTVIASPELRA